MGPSLVHRYLASLPKGFDSYPDVQAKASVLLQLLDDVRLPRDELPPELAQWLAERPEVMTWIPEVHLNAVTLAIYEHRFANDPNPAHYDQWVYERNRRLLSTPLYKVLFMVVSPERLLLGAEKRWTAFRRGTSLHVVEATRTAARVLLRYPSKLQTDVSMRGVAAALRAALHLAGGKLVSVVPGPVGERETVFDTSWR